MNKQYAVIKNGDCVVENTIVAPADYQIDGFYLVELSENNHAQPGAFYNSENGMFYGDRDYTTDYKKFTIG
ncbi:hypothetical protein QNH99_03360 [Pantoea allii]|uniref:hypothetical protein n=1 Tax=Pantoea allii TaxID=574096 RepID=UPI0024B835DF|nr:hypothetical protein [Pantoea allii]MDJ0039865.1 hypothetical protein [Pantoea allii]MDJ0088253.1 hypothetical protein [Pantoea allii]